jgi:putative ABC transport system permease protein
VISFIVSNRTRELGIRRALGADGPSIVRLVTRSGLLIVLAGTTLGLAAAYGLARLIESRLFRVSALDLTSYAGAVVLLALVAGVAFMVPARAALRIDPAATLRQE